MFYKKNESNYRTVTAGVSYKTLAYGNKTHLTEFRLAEGSRIPMHKHPHEQTGYLISGRLTFMIAGEKYQAEPGDGWNITGGVEHSVEVPQDALVIEIFSPIREDYLIPLG
jgi:quercetin dioxygenase-like cupin family protein